MADIENVFRYYEGSTSANTVLKDLSKVLTCGVKTTPLKADNGEIIKKAEVIQDKNFDIVYPAPVKNSEELVSIMDWNNLTPDEYLKKINNQLDQITDTVILKTTTTSNGYKLDEVDDMGLDNDLAKQNLTMYVELYKPKYLADNEQFSPDCERNGIYPYLVTQDIYKQYAKKTGTKTIDLKAGYAGKGINISYPHDSGSNNYSPSSDAGKFFQDLDQCLSTVSVSSNFKNTYDTITTTTNNTNMYTLNIKSSKLQKMFDLNPKSNCVSVIKSAMKLAKPEKEYDIKITIGHYYKYIYNGDYTAYYVYTISWDRTYEYYSVNSFKYDFEFDADKIYYDTFKVALEDGTDITNYFTIDKTNNRVLCNSTPSYRTEEKGSIIMTYNYKNDKPIINSKALLNNNHYIYIRIFDKLNAYGNGPIENTVDSVTNQVTEFNGHVSEWSKLSWYQDFETIQADTLDDDVGENDLSEGVVYLPTNTPGLTGDTKFKFWVNTNNDKAAIVLMGNPSLSFNQNKHLISCAYIGKIESFENSINDTAGNFALFTSSSTIPCDCKTNIVQETQKITETIGAGDGTTVSFNITIADNKYLSKVEPTSITLTDKGNNVSILNQDTGYTYTINSDNQSAIVTFFNAPSNGTTIDLTYSYYKNTVKTTNGITRDGYGNILDVVYPQTYGSNTATGVIDVAMYHTATKAYYQKHHFMFAATEEFMTKEMYGKSAYTGEYYADKIKIVHGNDGVRGMLYDLLAIDTSSLYAFDELVVNRNFSKDNTALEETYVYFPITAPYSPFAGSTNSTYGIALKKSIEYPTPSTDKEKLDQAVEELYMYVGNLKNLTEDIVLPEKLKNNVTVTWESSNTELIEIVNG